MTTVPPVSTLYVWSGVPETDMSLTSARYQYPAFAEGMAKVTRGQFSPPALGTVASLSADATESSISLIDGSVVLLPALPAMAVLVIVYSPATLAVQKSFTWF